MAGIDAAVGANLPVSWALAPLGEVTRPGRPKVRPADFPQLPFIGMEHVEAHTMRLLGTVPAGTMKSQAVHFFPGDVLYGRLRPYLNKVFRPDFEGLCSAEFMVFPATDDLDRKYLQYFLNSSGFVSFAAHLDEGDRPRVDFTQLSGYLVPVAPLSEQRRIVAEIEKQFTRLDAAVAAFKRVQAELKQYRASVLKAGCEGRLVPTEAEIARAEGREYESGDQLLDRVRVENSEGPRSQRRPSQPMQMRRASSLPGFPEGWAWACPQTLAEPKENAICAGPFGTIFKARDFRPSGVPIIFLRHIKSGAFLTDRPGFMDSLKWSELFKPYSVFGGELLITKLGDPPGECAIYPDNAGPAMVTPDVIKMSVNRRVVDRRYLMHYLNSRTARGFAMGAAFGTTRLRVTLPIFRVLPVPLPPLAEQQRIVAEIERRLSVIESLEAVIEMNMKRVKSFRQALLKRAFEGKLVRQDPTDEPASLPLERIQVSAAAVSAGRRPRVVSRKRSARIALDSNS